MNIIEIFPNESISTHLAFNDVNISFETCIFALMATHF